MVYGAVILLRALVSPDSVFCRGGAPADCDQVCSPKHRRLYPQSHLRCTEDSTDQPHGRELPRGDVGVSHGSKDLGMQQ